MKDTRRKVLKMMRLTFLVTLFCISISCRLPAQDTVVVEIIEPDASLSRRIIAIEVDSGANGIELLGMDDLQALKLPKAYFHDITVLVITTKHGLLRIPLPDRGIECGYVRLKMDKGKIRKSYEFEWNLCGVLNYSGLRFVEDKK